MADNLNEIEGWLGQVRARVPSIARLLDAPAETRRERGYDDTVTEILQQPVSWDETATRAVEQVQDFRSLIMGSRAEGAVRAVVLTGSGSSLYICECVAPALQSELGLPVRAVGGGDLLTHPVSAELPGRPCLLVSVARSGNSPESAAAVEYFLKNDPECRHLFLTCNAQGRLATAYRDDRRTRALVHDDRTNDRSLVMTTSFTNLALASRFIGFLDRPDEYRDVVDRLGKIARSLVLDHADVLADVARRFSLCGVPWRRMSIRCGARGRSENDGDERGSGAGHGRDLPRTASRSDGGYPRRHAHRVFPLHRSPCKSLRDGSDPGTGPQRARAT